MKRVDKKTVITTHPGNKDQRLANFLLEAGILVYNLPMIQIVYNQPDVKINNIMKSLENYNLLVFTSRNGVRGFFKLLESIIGNYKLPEKIKIVVIGESTSKEVERFNHIAHFTNSGFTSEELSVFLKKEVISKNSKVLFALGNLASNKLQTGLNEICITDRIDVYQTIKPDNMNKEILKIVKKQKSDLIVFTSPSAFKNFMEITEFTTNDFITKIACIGKTTGSYIKSEGYNVNLISSNPSIEFFAQEIISYLNKSN